MEFVRLPRSSLAMKSSPVFQMSSTPLHIAHAVEALVEADDPRDVVRVGSAFKESGLSRPRNPDAAFQAQGRALRNPSGTMSAFR